MTGWLTAFVYAALGVAALVMLVTYAKTRKPLRMAFGSLVEGVCAMAAVDIVGIFSGVSLGFGTFSLACCAVFGIPGVISMLLMRAIALF